MIDITEAVSKESIRRLAGTDDGRIVLAWLKEYCFQNNTALVPGDLTATYANAAVQGVYRALRSFIGREDLKKIEFEYVIKKTTVTRKGMKDDK